MDPEVKSQHYFGKGINAFINGNYEEALNLFIQSQTYKDSKDTQQYIKQCKEKLQSNVNERQQQQQPSQQSQQSQQEQPTSNEADDECKAIINSHDYYQILDLDKTCSIDDIKRAYKQKAMKFHPDKNNSKFAEEAFKKISTAYQTLSDPDKRKIFDKYGSEEQFREKYYQEHKRQYEDEYDPFDLFQMFMNGGFDAEKQRRQQRNNTNAQYAEQNPKFAKLYMFIQLLPMLMMMVYYFLPHFMDHGNKQLFAFEQSEMYPYRKVTSENEVVYYVGSNFVNKYKKEGEEELGKYEKEIEKKYLEYLYETCDESKQMKRQLENQLRSYTKGSVYYNYYQKELNKVDLQACDLYDEFKDVIN